MTTIGDACIAVLKTTDAADKAAAALLMGKKWFDGDLSVGFSPPPDRPNRPEKPKLLPPRDMPKRRGAGTNANKVALLHAVAHIELNAIDLAFDIVARFASTFDGEIQMDFINDWIEVGMDEARHFTMVATRLVDLDCQYGDLPAHDGLWEAAQKTAHDILARLAIVPMVLEARGLDVTPNMITRFTSFGDSQSAALLQVIYDEEISHVAKGNKWFNHLCEMSNIDKTEKFHTLVNTHFSGGLIRPFNHKARAKAGLIQDYYEPLA